MTLFELAITCLILLYGVFLTCCSLNDYHELGQIKQNTPPSDLSPGFLGYLEKGQFDFELFAAELFYLQNLGYVLIEVQSKSYRLVQLKQADRSLPSYLVVLLNQLFQREQTFIIGKFNQLQLQQTIENLKKSYQKRAATFYKPSFLVGTIAMALAFATVALPCIEAREHPIFLLDRVLIVAVTLIGFIIARKYHLLRYIPWFQYSNRQVIFKILLLIMTSILFFHQQGWDVLSLSFMTFSAAAGIAYFSFVFRKLNEYGVSLFRRLNGFKGSLTSPDPDIRLISLNETKLEFIRKSPYAFALALEYPLITAYSSLSNKIKAAENNYLFFEKHFKAYLKLTHCVESVYYRKSKNNRLLQFSW